MPSVHRFQRRVLKGFYHIWAWWPSWSCDLDYLYTHWFPLSIDASHKLEKTEKKIYENVNRQTHTQKPAQVPSYKLPFGLGELKMQEYDFHGNLVK